MNKPKFQKTEKIEIRCTQEQKKIIKARAEELELTVSKYIIMMALLNVEEKQ